LSQRGESISRELVRNLDLKSREQTNVELHGGDKEQRQIDEDWTRDVGQHLGLKLFGKIDPGKNEERVQEVQLFTSSVSAGSTLVSRLMKVATVSAMLLGMSVTGLQVHRMPASEVSAPTNPVAPFTASTPPAPINGLVPQLAPATNTIQVTPGQSLYRICSASFGTCSPELIQEIRKLNPHVDNPDHVESGQKLRIPARPSTLRTTADILEPAGMAPPEKRDVQ
jgi:LysM repeat protein